MMMAQHLKIGLLVGVLLAGVAFPVCAEDTGPPVIIQNNIDITIPRVQIKPPPYSETLFHTYDALPARLYFNASVEPSYRLETNPYQAPHGFSPFYQSTEAFRVQSGASLGYALSRRTRISTNYFMLSDKYDNFTPFRLDNSSQSVGATLEHDWLSNQHWLLRSSMVTRQLFTSSGYASGDLIPSTMLMRVLGSRSYTYLNGSLDINRNNFFIGDSVERVSPIVTLGWGYSFPYVDQPSFWQKILGGTNLSLSSTYSYGKVIHPGVFVSDRSQSVILTAEVARNITRKLPIQMFMRAEPVFNFGQEFETIGISGFNFRLFGGMRASLNKPATFTNSLKPAKEESAKKAKETAS